LHHEFGCFVLIDSGCTNTLKVTCMFVICQPSFR